MIHLKRTKEAKEFLEEHLRATLTKLLDSFMPLRMEMAEQSCFTPNMNLSHFIFMYALELESPASRAISRKVHTQFFTRFTFSTQCCFLNLHELTLGVFVFNLLHKCSLSTSASAALPIFIFR